MSRIPTNLLAMLPDDLWPDTVTFEQPDSSGTYQPVTDLTAIDCREMAIGKGNANESQTWAIEMGVSHIIQLRGYYPAVSFDMRMNVNDGTFYEIEQNGIRHANKTITSIAASGTQSTA